MKIGLKVYSTDITLVPDAARLIKADFFDYTELYIIPGFFESTISKWKSLNCPFIIHAPHSYHGINFARADMWKNNQRNFKDTQLFADSLRSDTIIVHGGNNGSFDETLRQLELLNEKRIILENKPKMGINNEVCVGTSPSEFRKAADRGLLNGMALDFGHAVCSAHSSGSDTIEMIKEFMIFNPKVYHLSDGDSFSEKDIHLNFGRGNFNIKKFLSFIPENGFLTIETPRNPSNNLKDFISDVNFLQNIFLQTR